MSVYYDRKNVDWISDGAHMRKEIVIRGRKKKLEEEEESTENDNYK